MSPFFVIFGHFLVLAGFITYSAKMDFFYSNYPRDIDFSQSKSEILMLWMGCAQQGCQLHHYTTLKAELPDQENCAVHSVSIYANATPICINLRHLAPFYASARFQETFLV